MVDRNRDCVFKQLCFKGTYLDEITKMGDVVRIAGITRPTVNTYTPGSAISRESKTANLQNLYIDQFNYINVGIERTDEKQTQGKIVKAEVKQAKEAFARSLDENIAALYTKAANTITNADCKSSNVTSDISMAERYLLEADVPLQEKKYLVITPAIYEVLRKAKIVYDTNNSDMFGMGYIGKYMSFDVFVSNSIQESNDIDYCMAFTNRAIGLAEQILPGDTEFYRPHDSFQDAFKALHVFGRKVLVPGELVQLALTPATSDVV